MAEEPTPSDPLESVTSLEEFTPGQKEFLTEAEKRGVTRDLFGEHIPEINFREKKSDPNKPTIALINTGGTLMMVPSKTQSGMLSFDGAIRIPRVVDVMDAVSIIRKAINIIGIDLGSIDSKDADVRLWQTIAAAINTVYEQVHGVVVGHGTHTLEYSAPATAYALQQPAIPIVFTASQIPILEHIGSDGLPNLTGAIQIAAFGEIAEVVAYAHGEIHRATRVAKASDNRLNFLESRIDGPIGHLTASGIDLRPEARIRWGKRKYDLKFLPKFNSNVGTVKLHPGMDRETVDYMCSRPNGAGMVIETFGSGAVPKKLVKVIVEHTKRGLPIYLSSTCGQSGISNGMQVHDEDAKAVYDAGIRNVGDMSTAAALVKLMHVLGNNPRGDMDVSNWLPIIREEMIGKNYAGEITLASKDRKESY